MKMDAEHYFRLKMVIKNSPAIIRHGLTKLEEVYVKDHASGALKAKDIHMRLRWDIFHTVNPIAKRSLMDDFYAAGLNDTHIDTALKKVIKELK